MPYTQLSLTATPGRRWSFSAKEAAGPHTGEFTELSVMATPGKRHAFSAKSTAEEPETPSLLDEIEGAEWTEITRHKRPVYTFGSVESEQPQQRLQIRGSIIYAAISGSVRVDVNAGRMAASGTVIDITDEEIELIMALMSM